jgi:hypothetical protein
VSGVVPRTLVPGKPGSDKAKDKKGGTGI